MAKVKLIESDIERVEDFSILHPLTTSTHVASSIQLMIKLFYQIIYALSERLIVKASRKGISLEKSRAI